ncbi:hypothetical protein ALC56_04177 [Trachymyrmex septentrionalis]|uniref:Peptidase A2 domain-containing protein n=1 Tax=Trachymyrmex septentrionalis TaxID=34720 RepID=A0A151JY79_9HYME|nr:hypothetical protein ALC56_04177 [Trachymyrmex septentrionalis]
MNASAVQQSPSLLTTILLAQAVPLLASQIPVFYGSTDDDADRWLGKVERAAAVHGINDNVKLAANGKIQKLARDWYDMEEESTNSWFIFKEAFIKRFRRQVSFTRMMQKAEACRWNSYKENFLDYAAKKIKLLQPLHLEQKSIINLLIGGIQNHAIKSAAAMIYVETTAQIQTDKSIIKVNYVEEKKCDLLALIDTGSPVSFIRGLFKKYREFCVFSKIIYLFMNIYFVPFKVIPIRYYTLVPTNFNPSYYIYIIDNDNWSTYLVLGTDFLSQNNLALFFKLTVEKSENNLKLINAVTSADITEEDDFPIAQKLKLILVIPMVYHELLKSGQTVTGELYREQIIQALRWEVLRHGASPDYAPSDYHLFRSMAHALIAQQQIAQQQLFTQQQLLEQLGKARQTTNVALDTSLNLESGSNRNPEVKSSVPCTSIPIDAQDEFHTYQTRFTIEEITNVSALHQPYPVLATVPPS